MGVCMDCKKNPCACGYPNQPKKDRDVIAVQAKELYKLADKCKSQAEALKQIYSMMICIGGPLNDNFHGYNKKQCKIFFRMREVIESVK